MTIASLALQTTSDGPIATNSQAIAHESWAVRWSSRVLRVCWSNMRNSSNMQFTAPALSSFPPPADSLCLVIELSRIFLPLMLRQENLKLTSVHNSRIKNYPPLGIKLGSLARGLTFIITRIFLINRLFSVGI